MPLRRLVYLTIAVCLVAGLVTFAVLKFDWSTERKVALDGPAYAYTTTTELVVMRGDQVLTRVNRPFDKSDPHNNQVVWSNDGRYVAFLAGVRLLGEDGAGEKLVGIDVLTGDRHEFRCPDCSWIAAVGGDEVLASDGSKFRKFTLSGRSDGEEFDQPAYTTADDYVRIFLAGTRHLALTAGQVPLGRTTGEKLELISPEGMLHFEVGSFDSNSYLPAAGISGPTAADTVFAVAVRNNPGLCQSDFPVKLVSADGQVADTDWGDAAPPGFVPNEAQGIEVHDLWWDDSRTLHATIVSWTCDDTKQDHYSKKVLHSASKLWKLDGRRWVLEDESPATVVRPLSGGGRVVLAIPDCFGEVADPQTHCRLGTLQTARDGQRSDVATGVLMVYAPPATSGEPVRRPSSPGSAEALLAARVPSLCGHPEGTLQNGKLPGISEHDGFVQLAAAAEKKRETELVASADVTGDGKAETAAVFQCSQGGVAWPENVVLYDDRAAVLGKVDLGSAVSSGKASVERLEAAGGGLRVRWKTYEGAGSCRKTWSAQLGVANGAVEVTGLTQVEGTKDAC